MTAPGNGSPMRVVGRYVIHEEIASGGMAVVHMGRLQGPVGFAKTVAIKRLHDSYARDPEFVEMFLDEARIAARIQHPNVVPILDVVALDGELFLVLEYVRGPALTRLLRRTVQAGMLVEPRIAVAIGASMLAGLHAAHEARRESGDPLEIVHRDVNPQNVIVGADGVARVLDFGIAKASYRYHNTGHGVVKGKLRYMAPEQVAGKQIDRRTDIFTASSVIWEMLAGQPFVKGEDPASILNEIVHGKHAPPSSLGKGIPPELDRVVLRGLAPYPKERYQTAADMAAELERSLAPATAREIGEWVADVCGDWLQILDDKKAVTEGSVSPLEMAPPAPGSPAAAPGTDPRLQATKGESSSTHALQSGMATSNRPPDDAALAEAMAAPAQRKQTMGLIIGSAIGVALVLGLLAFAFLGGNSAPRALDVSGLPKPSAIASASAAPAESVAELDAEPPEAPPSASQAPVAIAPSAPAPAISAKPKGGGTAAAPSKGAKCRPPYTIGPDGVKRYKPECF